MMHHGITKDMVDRLFGEFFCFSLGGGGFYMVTVEVEVYGFTVSTVNF